MTHEPATKARYFFRIEYDGGAYAGWQRQENAPTVQHKLEEAFSTILRAPCAVTGAGRTDAGVHARRQGAHVDVCEEVDPERTARAVNAVLPPDIRIFDLQTVSPGFHARFNAVRRSYKYYIATDKQPLVRNRVWTTWYTVDWDRIAHEMTLLIGPHDFTTFCATDTTVKNMVCDIQHVSLTIEHGLRIVRIDANRFVYRMVRSLVGTLIDIGRGRLKPPITEILNSRDRHRAGATAPAWGLTLDNVLYPAGTVVENTHYEY
jgi:tRNA pseudouridine38-40 synthase